MRIALLSHAFPPEDQYGIARYVAGLAQGLAGCGHDVTVLTGTPDPARLEQRDGYRIFWLPNQTGLRRVPALGPVRLSRHFAQCLRRLHSETPFDVVEYPNYRFPGLWPAWRGIGGPRPKFVLRLSSPWVRIAKSGGGLRLFERLEAWNARRSDAVIGNSQATLALARETYRLPAHQPATVILHALTPPGPPPEWVPVQNDGAPRLLFIGRMESLKGFDLLARVWPAVVQAVPAARLAIVGEDFPAPPHSSFVQWALKDLPPAALARLEYHGFVTPAIREKLLCQCDLLVAPSRYESFGLVLLDAFRYGRPVVSSAVGGIPEVVRHGETGLLVPPDDPAALTQALVDLLTDAERRRALGQAAVRDLQTRFTLERMVRETETFYRQLLGSS